ncbi:CYTH domain-containing protein [Flavitalea sp. BT771]|uniref:CYTH domain-containing protein n=1 Tax=Flavitalea sp. BT771 TaxID=3063329 RepID=UPI0026E2537A|nr:CYTH domain-containing protein [Flavitalea sp. BT771]MDO6433674.1 CYTH domain-containing protein [Flavitalea sp. BT771]MDV6222421.1 CYTH domain-containing protein [Flavitalea sp. BT771]
MGIEIERKYLIKKDKWNTSLAKDGVQYRQGYILTDPSKTIRVRLAGEQGYLTIKGLSEGASRPEFEYEIPKEDAIALLDNFCPATISKVRYKIQFDNHLWEIDEFSGDNEGLIVAEIELAREDETFTVPDWIDKEVTAESRYYNSNLTIHPYKDWK